MERGKNWLLCPHCGGKTRLQIRRDTILFHYPLFCPKCKKEFLINAKALQVDVLTEITYSVMAANNL